MPTLISTIITFTCTADSANPNPTQNLPKRAVNKHNFNTQLVNKLTRQGYNIPNKGVLNKCRILF